MTDLLRVETLAIAGALAAGLFNHGITSLTTPSLRGHVIRFLPLEAKAAHSEKAQEGPNRRRTIIRKYPTDTQVIETRAKQPVAHRLTRPRTHIDHRDIQAV